MPLETSITDAPAAGAAPRPTRGMPRLGLRAWQIALLVGILIAGGAAVATVVATEHLRQDRAADLWAARAATGLDREVQEAGAVLTATRGLFAASDRVEEDEFARFTEIELEATRLTSLNWVERVTPDERAGAEAALGRPILGVGPDGHLARVQGDEDSFPLTFTAPVTVFSNLGTGVDVMSDRALAASLDEARDRARPVVVQTSSFGGQSAAELLSLVAPVYDGPTPGAIDGRRAALSGFVGGFFDVAGMAASTRSILPAGGRLQIVGEAGPLYDTDRGAPIDAAHEAPIGTTGLRVRIELRQGSAVWALPALVIAGATLAVALLVGVLFLQSNERRRDRAAAQRVLQQEADTDGLTGLANRRSLERDLADVVATASPDEPQALILLDLNGFKGYNDRFGHPAGDALLVRLSSRLATAVRGGRAYRLGGDEFCVLAPVGPQDLMGAVSAALEALSESGEGFRISAAHGVALIPEEAGTPGTAMLVADRRMYARKAMAGRTTGDGSADVLLRALAEHTPTRTDRIHALSDLVWRVAERLGLDETDRRRARSAALLHDVGKIAIPEAILVKRDGLDAGERDFIRHHTAVGDRILRAAPALEPIAPLVRSSLEHWDGSGRPDGLAGEQIPLGARILGACVAFAELTTRSGVHGAPLTRDGALAQMDEQAGRRFDPAVVAALAAVAGAGTPGLGVSPPAAPAAP